MKFRLIVSIFLLILIIFLSFYLYFKRENKVEYQAQNREVSSEKDDSLNKLNLLFVGDAMFDRYIRKKINESDTPESFIKNFLTNLSLENKQYDYVIANLEGPITENKSKTLHTDGTFGKELIFTFPTSTVKILNLLNIRVVSLANNHEDNFHNQGFQDTKKFLQESGVNYFGNPYNDTQNEEISKTICQKNICIAYIGYNQFTKYNSPEIVVKEIQKLKQDPKVDFIVVFAHFGEEYELEANSIQTKCVHSFIDAGADLVIGAHPHVIQNQEIYKGKYIYYSLGNYIFDQWFNENVSKGLGVNFAFSKDSNGDKKIKLIKEIEINISKENIRYSERN